MNVNVSRVAKCSPQTAWDLMTDPRNDPLWWKGVIDTEITSGGEHGVGTFFRQKNKLFGMTFDITFEVTEFDPPRRQVMVTRSGPTPFVAIYEFEPVDGGTRVTMSGEVAGTNLLFRAAGPVFRWHLNRVTDRYMDNLQRVLAEREAAKQA